jgi:hypothetical protein
MLKLTQKKITLLLSILLFGSAACKPQIKRGDAVLMKCRDTAGMFSVLIDALAVLECYDVGFCSGVKIDFGVGGLYFDQQRGQNWFNYYFEPITLGVSNKPYFETNEPTQNGLRNLEFDEPSRLKINHLINKYLKIRPELIAEIDHFVEHNFKNNFVIGLHYRGTDKGSEAPLVKYDRAESEIRKQIEFNKFQNYKIFIATDEHDFLEYMKAKFPGHVIFHPDIQRSKDGKPLHMGKSVEKYESGKHALLDCVLLSKTDFLIRTSSNLSLFSTYLNPQMPVFELNKRY